MSDGPHTQLQRPRRRASMPDLRAAARPKYEPFCSRRCADVDLHRWLKGTYVIPGAERPSVESDSADEEE